MAWRDSRRQRGRLMLFVSSIVLGIAALVAINSFSANLQKDINGEAKTLLGADLMAEGNQPPPPNLQANFEAIEGEKARTVSFVSMVFFPKNEGTKLAQIVALEGGFPFYGQLQTSPATAQQTFRSGAKALVDKSLMLQFGLEVGDSVKIGEITYFIEGKLESAPGRAGIASAVAPAIYVPLATLEATGLVQKGSRITYQYAFKTAENTDGLLKKLKPSADAATYTIDSVESRKETLGNAFGNMRNFLNLVAFVALLLGCIGVASAVHIYVKDKLASVAVLRCLGASGRQAFLIYLIQIGTMGLLGAMAGAALGSVLQKVLPLVLGDFLPVQNISTDLSFIAIIQGVVTGFLVSVLFALIPLLDIRHISPLHTLRASFEEKTNKFDPWKWVVYGMIAFLVVGFAWVQTRSFAAALSFVLGIAVALLLLVGVARLLMFLLRKYFPAHLDYVWRQGIANLYRPNNQTLTLMTSIGLGTMLIATLFFIQNLLLQQVELSGSGKQPNTILFDIQSSQIQGVAQTVRDAGLPVLQQVPIVTMRLEKINEETKTDFYADSTRHESVPEWVFDREYRCTYRDTLIDTEKIMEGSWHGGLAPRTDGIVNVSLADRVAKAMNAKIGMRLLFNVQGTPVEAEVSSIRKVDFNRVQTNFFVVFPNGILEKAPQFHVIVTRADSAAQSANFQKILVKNFPNVSIIDLTQILKTADSVLGKVSFVIRFMALFSILTGFVVLASSIALSRSQRIRESVLLRTLGASRRQIRRISALEYFILGALAAATGLLLSVLGAWALARFAFQVPFSPNFVMPLAVFFGVALLTLLIGLLNTRSVLNSTPLEVLRSET